MLEATAEPAFACDDDGRIVAWNVSIEELSGYSAQQALGRPCWEVLRGHDVFGNTYCNEFCNVRRTLSRNEPIHGFEMDVRKASGEMVRVLSSTLVVGGGRGSKRITIHLLRPTSRVESTEHERGEPADCLSSATPVASVIPPAANGCPKMTARQIEILGYLAEGRSSKAIAQALDISVLTVRTHTRNILSRCRVHNIRQAMSAARRYGLI